LFFIYHTFYFFDNLPSFLFFDIVVCSYNSVLITGFFFLFSYFFQRAK